MGACLQKQILVTGFLLMCGCSHLPMDTEMDTTDSLLGQTETQALPRAVASSEATVKSERSTCGRYRMNPNGSRLQEISGSEGWLLPSSGEMPSAKPDACVCLRGTTDYKDGSSAYVKVTALASQPEEMCAGI